MLFKFSVSIPYPEDWLLILLEWVDQEYPYFVFLQSNGMDYPHDCFPYLIQAGNRTMGLEEIEAYKGNTELVGVVSFDYKIKIEKLSSNNEILIDLPDSVFIIPDLQIEIGTDYILIVHTYRMISKEEIFGNLTVPSSNPLLHIQGLKAKEKYISNIKAIKEHIRSGDIHELNYCMAFFLKEKLWNPIIGYLNFMKIYPMPFPGLFRSKDKYLICASPVLILKKTGEKIVAQSIKGTIRRGKDVHEDTLLRNFLMNTEKERAENLMLLELIRIDFSRISKTGSVQVEECMLKVSAISGILSQKH